MNNQNTHNHHNAGRTFAVYSIQPSGPRARILVTRTPGTPGTSSAAKPATTATLITLEADLATRVTSALENLQDARDGLLRSHAEANPGQVCYLRRALVATDLGERRDETGAAAHDLADLVSSLTGTQKRAIADEVGRLFDGTEDVLVTVDLTDEFGGLLYATLATVFLPTADDDELLGLVDPFDEVADMVLYEGLLAELRADDDAINEIADHGWVDVNIDRKALAAWLRRNRPHLADQIDEVEEALDYYEQAHQA